MGDLVDALDTPTMAHTRHFLDTETGEVEYVPLEVEDDEAFKDILEGPKRFVQIPPALEKHRYRVRDRFAQDVRDPQLRLSLTEALDLPKRALSEFERRLRLAPEERDRWFRFRERAFADEVRAFLASLDIVAIEDGG